MSKLFFKIRNLILMIILICSIIFIIYTLFIIRKSKLNQNQHLETRFSKQLQPALAKNRFDYIINDRLPWFIDGPIGPAQHYDSIPASSLAIWPGESAGDRIANQLMYVPDGYTPYLGYEKLTDKQQLKKIILANGARVGPLTKVAVGQKLFKKCPVNTCQVVDDSVNWTDADAVIFSHKSKISNQIANRVEIRPDQVMIFFSSETAITIHRRFPNRFFNWTVTFRSDSEISFPYFKLAPVGRVEERINLTVIANKTKKVAWFVSNCRANNNRLSYGLELAKYIQVDIYGRCGNLKCRYRSDECVDMLNRDYKFYLAFENSNCREYITEKFFNNALGFNRPNHYVVPIVMGADRRDYETAFPFQAFIHVDDFESPRHLAEFLHRLDTDDLRLAEYHRWKTSTRFYRDTYMMCRVCALLHSPSKPSITYNWFNEWWMSTCRRGSDNGLELVDRTFN